MKRLEYLDCYTTYELFQKTQKNEKPKECECGKRIKKGMYFTQADAGEYYCLECSTK